MLTMVIEVVIDVVLAFFLLADLVHLHGFIIVILERHILACICLLSSNPSPLLLIQRMIRPPIETSSLLALPLFPLLLR